jgi:hypothetical protein
LAKPKPQPPRTLARNRHRATSAPLRAGQTLGPQDRAEIKLATLKAPTLVGFADECWLGMRHQIVEFALFESRGTDTYIIARFVMAIDDLVKQFWPATAEFHQALVAQLEKSSFAPLPLATAPPARGQTAPVLCNIVQVSRHGLDAQFDCHYVTARSVANAKQGKGTIDVLPILSVQLPTTLLVSILSRLSEQMPVWQQQMNPDSNSL